MARRGHHPLPARGPAHVGRRGALRRPEADGVPHRRLPPGARQADRADPSRRADGPRRAGLPDAGGRALRHRLRRRVPSLLGRGPVRGRGRCRRRQGRLVPARRHRRGRVRSYGGRRRAAGGGHLSRDRVAPRRAGPPMRYPETRRDDTVEHLHGEHVADPYRWLEDPDSPETRDWVVAQNRLSREHLDALPSRAWFQETLQRILARPRAGTPDKVGDRYLVSRNDGTQQQDQWFVADTLDELVDGGRLLIDPNPFSADRTSPPDSPSTFSAHGTSSLAGYNDSRDGRWLAYLVSDGGSDWTTIRVKDLRTGENLDPEDLVTKVKFSEATWLPDDESYLYVHFPTEGTGVGTEAEA